MTRDDRQAYFWWQLAAAGGHTDAMKYQDEIESSPTSQQRAAARADVSKWALGNLSHLSSVIHDRQSPVIRTPALSKLWRHRSYRPAVLRWVRSVFGICALDRGPLALATGGTAGGRCSPRTLSMKGVNELEWTAIEIAEPSSNFLTLVEMPTRRDFPSALVSRIMEPDTPGSMLQSE